MRQRGQYTLAVLAGPAFVWAMVHFRWLPIDSYPGRLVYGIHDYLWLPVHGEIWTRYYPWSLCLWCFICSILLPIYLSWLLSWRPLRSLHRSFIRAVAVTGWGQAQLPAVLQRVAEFDARVRGWFTAKFNARNVFAPQAPAWLRQAEAWVRKKCAGKWNRLEPRFLLEILRERRTEALWALKNSDTQEHFETLTGLTALESRVRLLPIALPEDRWWACAIWLEWDLVCATSQAAQEFQKLSTTAAGNEEYTAPLQDLAHSWDPGKSPLEEFCAALRLRATPEGDPRPASIFHPNEIAAAVLACLEAPAAFPAGGGTPLLTWLAEFEAALAKESNLPAGMAEEERAALGSLLCLFAAAVAQRAAHTSSAAAAALLGRHLALLERLRWRAMFEATTEAAQIESAMWRSVPGALVLQIAHELNVPREADLPLQEGSLWQEEDFAFADGEREAWKVATGPDFVHRLEDRGRARPSPWSGDAGLAAFHLRLLPQTVGRWPLRQRVDPVLVVGLGVLVGLALVFWTGLIGALDRLGRFDPAYSPDGKRPVADARILENITHHLPGSKLLRNPHEAKRIMDAALHRTSSLAEPRLFLGQAGGKIHIYNPENKLWRTEQPVFPELRAPQIVRLQSSSAARWQKFPLWGLSQENGLVQYDRGKWSAVVSDTYFAHPDGTPVALEELTLAARSARGERPDWILYGTSGSEEKPAVLGLYRPATRHWTNLPTAGKPLPFGRLEKIVWWNDAFYLGTNQGVFTFRPGPGAWPQPVKALDGREVLDLDVSRKGDLWVLDEHVAAGGAFRLSRLSGFGNVESPWDETKVYPEVNLSSMRYAFQHRSGPLYLGGTPGLLLYDPVRHAWQEQFTQPLTSFLATPARRGFYFGYDGGAGFVGSGQQVKKMAFGSSPVTRLKESAGRIYALTRPAGELFEISKKEQPIYNPGSTNFTPDSFFSGLAMDDQVLLVASDGVLRHSIVDRSYTDFSKEKPVPPWFCDHKPTLPLTESGSLIFGVNGSKVVSVPKIQAFAGTFQGIQAVSGGEVIRLHAGRRQAVLVQEKDNQCYEINNGVRRRILGPPIADLALGTLIDAAETQSSLFVATEDHVVPYRTGDRAWQPAVPLDREKPAELAAHDEDLFIATKTLRLATFSKDQGVKTWIGAPAGDNGADQLPLADSDLSDARLNKDLLFLAGRDRENKACLISYSLSTRRVVNSWPQVVQASPILAGIFNDKPVYQVGRNALLDRQVLGDATAERVLSTGEKIWVQRKDDVSSYLTGYRHGSGLLDSALFRFPSAGYLGTDVREAFVLSLGGGPAGEVLALAGKYGLRFYAAATRSWYRLPNNMVPVEAALLDGAESDQRFVFLAVPTGANTMLYFCPEKSFAFPLENDAARFETATRHEVRAYTLDAERHTVTFINHESGSIGEWKKGAFTMETIPAPGKAPSLATVRHIYDASDLDQIVLLVVDRQGGLWRYRRARGVAAWQTDTSMWTPLVLSAPPAGDVELALQPAQGDWLAIRTARHGTAVTIQQGRFAPRDAKSVSFDDPPLAQPVRGSYGDTAASLQDVVTTGDQPSDPWVFLGQQRVSWFDPDLRQWRHSLALPEAAGALNFLEVGKEFPLVFAQDRGRFWIPTERTRWPLELRARTRHPGQAAFLATAGGRDFGSVFSFSTEAGLQEQTLAAPAAQALEEFFEIDPDEDRISRVWKWPDSDHLLFDSSRKGLSLYDEKERRPEAGIRDENGRTFTLLGAVVAKTDQALWAHHPGRDELLRMTSRRSPDGRLSVEVRRWPDVEKFNLVDQDVPRIFRAGRWEQWGRTNFIPERVAETRLERWPPHGDLNAPAHSLDSGHLQPDQDKFRSSLVLGNLPATTQAMVATEAGIWLLGNGKIRLYNGDGLVSGTVPPVFAATAAEDVWIRESSNLSIDVQVGTAGIRFVASGKGLEARRIDGLSEPPVAPLIKRRSADGSTRYESDTLSINETKAGLEFVPSDGRSLTIEGPLPQLPLTHVYIVSSPRARGLPPGAPGRFYLRNAQGVAELTLTPKGVQIGPVTVCDDVRWATNGRLAWLKIANHWQPAPGGATEKFAQSTLLPAPPTVIPRTVPELQDWWPQMKPDAQTLFPRRGGRRVYNPVQEIFIDAGLELRARQADRRTEWLVHSGSHLALDERLPTNASVDVGWLKWNRQRAGFEYRDEKQFNPAAPTKLPAFLPKAEAMHMDGSFFFEETKALLPLFPRVGAPEPDWLAAANPWGVLFFPSTPAPVPLSLRRPEIVFQKIDRFNQLSARDFSSGHGHLLVAKRAWHFDNQRFSLAPGAEIALAYGDLRIRQNLGDDQIRIKFGRDPSQVDGYQENGGFLWDARSSLARGNGQFWLETPLGLQKSPTAEDGYLPRPVATGALRSVSQWSAPTEIFWKQDDENWYRLGPARKSPLDPRKKRVLVAGTGGPWGVSTDAFGVPAITWQGRSLGGVKEDGELSFPSDRLHQATVNGETLFVATEEGLEIGPANGDALRTRASIPRPLPGFQDLHTLPEVAELTGQPVPMTFLTTRSGTGEVTEKWDGHGWQVDANGQRNQRFRLVDTGAWQRQTAGRIVIRGKWPRGQETASLEKEIFLRLPGAKPQLQALRFVLGDRFPWDNVRTVAQQGGRLFLGTDAGLEVHALPLAEIGLGGGAQFLHLGEREMAPVRRVGLADPPQNASAWGKGTMLAQQAEHFFAVAEDGSTTFLPGLKQALATRLRVFRGGFWLWTQTEVGSRARGFYLREGTLERTPITFDHAGFFEHDRLADLACRGGESFAFWKRGWVTVSAVPDLGVSPAARPRNYAFPDPSGAASAKNVKLVELSHGPAVRAPGIPEGIFARVDEGGSRPLWKWEADKWNLLLPSQRKRTESEESLRTIYQHGRWRVMAQMPKEGTPPAGEKLWVQQRTNAGDWRLIWWSAVGSTGKSRYAIDDWLEFEPWFGGQEGLVATPLGVLLVNLEAGKARLDPNRALVLRGDFISPSPSGVEMRLAEQGALHLRVDRQTARVSVAPLNRKDPTEKDDNIFASSPADPFAIATYIRREDSQLWRWELKDDFDDPAGKSHGRLEAQISLQEKGASPIALEGGHFSFDKLKSIAFYENDVMELASADGWIRAPRRRDLALMALQRPVDVKIDSGEIIDPHDIVGVFPAAIPGDIKPQFLALRRKTSATQVAEDSRAKPDAGGDYLFRKVDTPAKRTGAASEFLGHDGFWQHARRADGQLEMRPQNSHDHATRTVKNGRFGDDTLLGVPVLGSAPSTKARRFAPTVAGIVAWSEDNRPLAILPAAETTRGLFFDPKLGLLAFHQDGTIAAADARPVSRLAGWKDGPDILGIEPAGHGAYHLRYELAGRRSFERFQLTPDAPSPHQAGLLVYPLQNVLAWQRLRSRYVLSPTLNFILGPRFLQVADEHRVLQQTDFPSGEFKKLVVLGDTVIYASSDAIWEIDMKGSVQKSARSKDR